jgi:Helix-turn-helix domain
VRRSIRTKSFQGVFAPYWIVEHRAISAGAKLCYVRLMGFAGRDARCNPSLETLGNALGVSERQARDYVKELERAKLIAIEQRGLRRTNIYLFLWTEELARMTESIPDAHEDPDDPSGDVSPASAPDRNNRSAQDRNSISAPDRNRASGQDRNSCSGPIGINSVGISSKESSSSSRPQAVEKMNKSTNETTKSAQADSSSPPSGWSRTAQTILRWAETRSVLRLRSDRQVGLPEKEHLRQWAETLGRAGLDEERQTFVAMDDARAAADRAGEWRTWAFLTLQVQLAAERRVRRAQPPRRSQRIRRRRTKISIAIGRGLRQQSGRGFLKLLTRTGLPPRGSLNGVASTSRSRSPTNPLGCFLKQNMRTLRGGHWRKST